MYIIKIDPSSSGSRPPLQSWNREVAPDGFALCPDEFVSVFYSTNPAGFVYIIVEDGVVTHMTVNQEAYDAYLEQNPPINPILVARSEKEVEMSVTAHKEIVAGMDVETTQGMEHFSLEETDQINLSTALTAIQNGAIGYPYHADGMLCRLYTAEEINAIAQAATNHKLYHTTLCNHLLTWVRRAETIAEIESIAYGEENLPEDLAENMAAIFAAAASV